VNRRVLFTSAIAVMIACLLIGCGATPVPTTPPVGASPQVPVSPTTPATATPAPFKPELVLCTTTEPATLVGSGAPAAAFIRAAVLPSAVVYGEDYIAEPLLLESLPGSEDGTLTRNSDGTLTVTLKYHDDLKWSDGTPFTAEDALLGLQVAPTASDPVVVVLDAQKVDGLTLALTLDNGAEYPYVPPQPPLPSHVLGTADLSQLAMMDYARIVSPALGPYMITEWVAGSHVLLNINPVYIPAPIIPVVRIRFIPDANQIAAEIASGGCDVALDTGLSLDQVAAFQTSANARTYLTPSPFYEQITFNTAPEVGTSVPYFADPLVRQAVASVIDRAALNQLAVHGLTAVMDSWLPADHWGYASGLTQYGVDAAAAGNLLAQAGWTDQDGDGVREFHSAGGVYSCQRGEWAIEEGTPLTPTLITTDDPVRQQLAEKIRTDLAQIGISVRLQTMSSASLFAADSLLARRLFDFALFSAAVHPDPGGINRFVGADVYRHPLDLTLVHRWQLEDRWLEPAQMVETAANNNVPSAANNWTGQNYSGWCSEQADLDIVAASEVINISERQTLLAQHQAAVANEVPVLSLFTRPRIAASANYVCGIVFGPYDTITWNIAAWYFDETGQCSQ
jgi:peptide/nickel transport system substrate-binding protein